jgi:hypothetical protein
LEGKGTNIPGRTSVDYDEVIRATGYTFAAKRAEEPPPDFDRVALKLFDGRFVVDEVVVEW